MKFEARTTDVSALKQIENSDELYDSCKKLIFDEELRLNMVDNAFKVVENNRGSMEKQYNYLKEYLN